MKKYAILKAFVLLGELIGSDYEKSLAWYLLFKGDRPQDTTEAPYP